MTFLIVLFLSLFAWAASAIAQAPGTIITIAGGGIGEGEQAVEADVRFPSGLSRDSAGNLFIADAGYRLIRQIGADGAITTVAGNTNVLNTVDGILATEAGFNKPVDIVSDTNENLYILDQDAHRIYKVDSKGIITLFAGTGQPGVSGDGGAAIQATFDTPSSIDLDGAGNLYIADTGNHRIRKIDINGIISTIAGDGNNKFSGDGGAAVQASVNQPGGVSADVTGNLFVADTGNHRVRKIDTDGNISTLAGNGLQDFSGDSGDATQASLSLPREIFVSNTGVLYVADSGNHRVRMVDTKGIITTIAGNGMVGVDGDGGTATAASLNSPRDLFVDGTGNVYIADDSTHRVRKVDTSAVITTIAGGMTAQGDGGAATTASLNHPTGMVLDQSGHLYISDARNHRIRKVDVDGMITTVVGNGTPIFSGDGGAATAASLHEPDDITMDKMGNIYIADTVNNRIRKVDAGDIISTVAGTDGQGFSGDGGAAAQAMLARPSGVDIDDEGNIYIADRLNHRIRKVDSKGLITTIAGNGIPNFGGDGGPAVTANLNEPYGIFIHGETSIYVADSGNHRIRKIGTDGMITTVAGNGTSGFSGDDGAAILASLDNPRDVFMDTIGNLYIADMGNARIRKVDTDGIITTVAGVGLSTASGDEGNALQAGFSPNGIFVDGTGNLYIADANHRIRKVIAQAILATDVADVSFGAVQTGASRDTTVTLTNSGSDTLHITDILTTDGVFTAHPTNLTILPGQSMVDTVRFTPVRTDTIQAFMIITSNALSSPDTLIIRGVGEPQLQAIPSDTSSVVFVSNDNIQATITVLSGMVTGQTLSFESYGNHPPPATQSVSVSDKPVFYVDINTSIPDSVDFEVEITLTYTDQQLADAGITNESSLFVAFFDDNTMTWNTVNAMVDPVNNTVMFNTSHLSIWALATVGPTDIEEDRNVTQPTSFNLGHARPNPFNPVTVIAYDIPERTQITLAVFNILGQEVIRLLDTVQVPGRYTVYWNGRNTNGQPVASGVYIYRLTSGTGFVQSKRVTLLK